MQAYHNELVSKVSRLEEENIKLKKEKVGRIFHFNQAVFYFFFREHLSTTPRGKMKEMAKWLNAPTEFELVFQIFNFGPVRIDIYSELF